MRENHRPYAHNIITQNGVKAVPDIPLMVYTESKREEVLFPALPADASFLTFQDIPATT